ncbi:MAG TPA: hypothetical protein VLE89_02310 [Chlamydiales bacterium]|nr:hypothetical protein [Chlamydiales bacterium]
MSSSRIFAPAAAFLGLGLGVRTYANYDENRAVGIMRQHKLRVVPSEGTFALIPPYGIYNGADKRIKAGHSPAWVWKKENEGPKSTVLLKEAAPVVHFLERCAQRRDLAECAQPLHQATKEWEERERIEQRFGPEFTERGFSKEDQEKADYYAEVAKIALKLGCSMPDLYQRGPAPLAFPIAKNGAIGLYRRGQEVGLITPLGIVQTPNSAIPVDVVPTRQTLYPSLGEVYSVAGREKLFFLNGNGKNSPGEWARIRPLVFQRLNADLQKPDDLPPP